MFRRRRMVVDPRFQLSLCAHAIAYGVLVMTAVTAGLFAPLVWHLGDNAPNQAVDNDSAVVMLYMHERFWALAGVCVTLVALGSLRLSHRIAGPLVRVKRNLRLIAEGKLPPPLRTRSHDYLKVEVQCLNDAVNGISQRVAAVRQASDELRRELAAAMAILPDADAARFAGALLAQRALGERLAGFCELDDLDAASETNVLPFRPVLELGGAR